MKRIVSIVLSILMLISCFSASCITASAYVASIETTRKEFNADVTVNGKPSIEAEYQISDNPAYSATVEFTYSGTETLQKWEIEGLKEGVDYVIISQDGNKLVIGIINDDINYVKANAITVTEDVPTTQESTTKKNTDHKSPDTGADFSNIILAIAALAGASAVIASKKRKNN